MASETETMTSEDEFDAAFAEIVEADEKVETTQKDEKIEEKQPDDVTAKVDEPAAGETDEAGEVDETEEVEPAPVTQQQAPASAPVKVEQAHAAPAKEEPAKVEDDPLANFKLPEPTPEMKAMMDGLEKEWPDVAAVMRAQLKFQEETLQAQFGHALGLFAREVDKSQAPLRHSAQVVAFNAHMSELRAAHPDYDKLIAAPTGGKAPLEAWIDTQPRILQGTYKTIYNDGSTADMKELVAAYKASTGRAAGPQESASATETSKKKQVASDKDASALAPVHGSKRATPTTQGVDMNDFDQAFNEYAAQEEKSLRRK